MASDTADWHDWDLDDYSGPSVGGHGYCLHDNALTDHRRKAEKAYHATGKNQVVHRHPNGQLCEDTCQVFGAHPPMSYEPRNGEIQR